MVDKRLGKVSYDPDDVMPPRFVGPDTFRNLVVCWGSNYLAVREALIKLGWKNSAMLHITQVHPFHAMVDVVLTKARKVIVVENNATGQLAKLMKLSLGYTTHEKILKYNGMPFRLRSWWRGSGKRLLKNKFKVDG